MSWWPGLEKEFRNCCKSVQSTPARSERLLAHYMSLDHVRSLAWPAPDPAIVQQRIQELQVLQRNAIGAETIVGWRLLCGFEGRDGSADLTGALGVRIEAALSPEARCRRFDHEAPELQCQCGYYMSRDVGHCLSIHIPHCTTVIALTLALGKTIEHQRGWRTRRLRYLAAWAPNRMVERVQKWGIPVFRAADLSSIAEQIGRDLATISQPQLLSYARLAFEGLRGGPG